MERQQGQHQPAAHVQIGELSGVFERDTTGKAFTTIHKYKNTVDNTNEALKQYYNGNGKPIHLGDETINALLSSDEFIFHDNRIRTGKTTLLTSNFGVDLTSSEFYIGHTNVDYNIECKDGNCKVTYTLFVKDGFWDPNVAVEKTLGKLGFPKFQPDGMGPNLEFRAGKPYPFIPVTYYNTFKNPGY